MITLVLFLSTSITKSVPFSINDLPSLIGMTLEDVIDRLELIEDKYWLGGGAGDHVFEYCIMSDENQNSYYLWVDAPMIALPNSFLDEDRDKKLANIFESSKKTEVIYISVINVAKKPMKINTYNVRPLNYYSGREVGDVIEDLGLGKERMVTVYNKFVNMHVLRIATKNGLVFELQIKPENNLPAKSKRKRPNRLMKDTVHLLRVYTGNHSPLKVQLLSLDGRRR